MAKSRHRQLRLARHRCPYRVYRPQASPAGWWRCRFRAHKGTRHALVREM